MPTLFDTKICAYSHASGASLGLARPRARCNYTRRNIKTQQQSLHFIAAGAYKLSCSCTHGDRMVPTLQETQGLNLNRVHWDLRE